MADAPYKTLKQRADDQFIVNKSRFIGYAAPCQSEVEALAFLKQIREKHKDATHNCYAYIIGRNMGIMRYSDDGEPGGTAGMPIIETMKKVGVTDCCVVVTRYFGGILLGAGGLVRAYRKGCVVALNAAQVVNMIPSTRFLMEVPYPVWDKVRYAMKDMPLQLEDTAFSTAVEATILVRTEDLENVQTKLTQVTDAKAEFLTVDESFYPWPEENPVADEE
ncbi:MAG: YigZ family protein [Clostridia bacterium]|nr:YigZ family protein [Clostridia bacterium]